MVLLGLFIIDDSAMRDCEETIRHMISRPCQQTRRGLCGQLPLRQRLTQQHPRLLRKGISAGFSGWRRVDGDAARDKSWEMGARAGRLLMILIYFAMVILSAGHRCSATSVRGSNTAAFTRRWPARPSNSAAAGLFHAHCHLRWP